MVSKETLSKDTAAFSRCIDFLVHMIEKYGYEVQEEINKKEIINMQEP